ncbi:MAG: Asp-tRNA(Asn)/Glu-tRNA(Gln) amidotransferase subunit GatA, partial [Candidatus Spechtbacterales bacterium]
GKTNLDEFAMGSSTENSAFGPTKNPHDPKRVPGGSSGGSAAAVASGMCVAALGSDTGGSIRQPAAFCGIVGFKPTYGAVSRYGLIAMSSSLDQIGPVTNSVEDARTIFDVIKGKDRFDATSLDLELRIKNQESRGLKIGIPKEYFGEGIDKDVKKSVEGAIKKYEENGARIEEISLPHTEYGIAVYQIIMASEVSANLARYDGIRYGLASRADDLLSVYIKTRRDGFGDEVRRRIILGTYALSSGYYDAYYLRAQKVRALIKGDFDKAFSKIDVIMTPATPTLPFKFGEKTKDPVTMYLSDVFTVSVNLAGLPAIVVPYGSIEKDGRNLPVGFQLIGPQRGDYLILDTAGMYGGFRN